MSDDSLRIPSVIGNNGAEGLSLPTACVTGKMTSDQVLILPVYSHEALPHSDCMTLKLIHTGAEPGMKQREQQNLPPMC